MSLVNSTPHPTLTETVCHQATNGKDGTPLQAVKWVTSTKDRPYAEGCGGRQKDRCCKAPPMKGRQRPTPRTVDIKIILYKSDTNSAASTSALDSPRYPKDASQHLPSIASNTASPHPSHTAAMCRTTIYYNTYGDGTRDVTERTQSCRPGKMCSHPERREVSRNFVFSKLATKSVPETVSTVAERKSTPYHTDFLELPPTPRSKTPSPSRRHESGVYVNGTKVADLNTKREKRGSTRREPPVVIHAPEPPSPRPFLKRSSTMPASQHIVVEERGRRHRDVLAQPQRASSREIAIGPVRILESLGGNHRSDSGSRRSASPRPPYYREHSRSARGYEYRDAEVARKEHVAPSRRASSLYGENNFASSSRRTRDVYMTPPPEIQVVPPKKELRWEDEERAKQNERIARRPKLHQEVKGILKKGEPVAQYDELRHAVGRMDIHYSEGRVQDGDEEYFDRLRNRFEEPRERRRRSRVYYPAEGLYKYM